MNTESNAVPELPAKSGVTDPGYSSGLGRTSHSDVATAPRPYFWSVKRELWENRSIYLAPVIVAAVVFFGFLVSLHKFPQLRRNAMLLDEAQRHMAIQMPYGMAAMVILMTGIIVGFFYCLDALYGERRDRSVLFWKSLPVSDLTTVLSKVTVPLAILPVVCFVMIFITQAIMLLLSSAVLLMNNLDPGVTWTHFPLFKQSLIMLYALIALALWHAPIYGWLLVVSAWARRTTFLWAVIPFVAITVFEKVTFNTAYFASLIKNRIIGFAPQAFELGGENMGSIDSLVQLTPGRYLATPGLWLGLIAAAALIYGAALLRRSRGPI